MVSDQVGGLLPDPDVLHHGGRKRKIEVSGDLASLLLSFFEFGWADQLHAALLINLWSVGHDVGHRVGYGLGDVISHEKRNLMLIVGWHNIWAAPYKSHPGSLKQYHSQHSINYKRGKRHGLGFTNSIKTTFGLMIFLKSFTLQF